jgi:hypothetical protein
VDVGLFLWRLLHHDLISPLVQWNIRVDIIEHLLEVCHDHGVQVGVPGVAGGQSGLRVIDVQLSIAGSSVIVRKKSTHFVMEIAMEAEGVRSRTGNDGIIYTDRGGGESKCGIILTNLLPEVTCPRSDSSEKIFEHMRRLRERIKTDLSLETAHAKPADRESRSAELFSRKVKSMTLWALHVHWAYSVMCIGLMVGQASRWDRYLR